MNTAVARSVRTNQVEKNGKPEAEGHHSMSAADLRQHIMGCVRNDRVSQKIIYSSFYGYAKAICDRYTGRYEDAAEIVNDGFLKVFKEMHRYEPAYADEVASFKGWLRRIVVHTAIDHFRKNHRHWNAKEIDNDTLHFSTRQEDAVDRLAYHEVVESIQELTPQYRTILNLFIMEGFSHQQIAAELGISVGASKSSLSKARQQLQKILIKKGQVK